MLTEQQIQYLLACAEEIYRNHLKTHLYCDDYLIGEGLDLSEERCNSTGKSDLAPMEELSMSVSRSSTPFFAISKEDWAASIFSAYEFRCTGNRSLSPAFKEIFRAASPFRKVTETHQINLQDAVTNFSKLFLAEIEKFLINNTNNDTEPFFDFET